MKAQIWVETVVYTLIGLTIIGIILGVATPRIEKARDQAVIEQTISMLNYIDEQINSAKLPGDVRIVPEIGIKRGKLGILSPENAIVFVLDDSSYMYSELGLRIDKGDISVLTEKSGKKYQITLRIDYQNNLTYNGQKIEHYMQKAAIPYKIAIENKGNSNIDIREI
jgi:type II secretory pathway pseudopilin PulG